MCVLKSLEFGILDSTTHKKISSYPIMPSQVVLDPAGGEPKAWVAKSRERDPDEVGRFVCKACDEEVPTAGRLVDHIHDDCAAAKDERARLRDFARVLADPLSQSELAKAVASWSSWEECHGGVVRVATYMEIGFRDMQDHPSVFSLVVEWARTQPERGLGGEKWDDELFYEFKDEYEESVYDTDPAIKIIIDHGASCHDRANAWMVAYLLLRVNCDSNVFERHGLLDFAVTSACFRVDTKRFLAHKADLKECIDRLRSTDPDA